MLFITLDMDSSPPGTPVHRDRKRATSLAPPGFSVNRESISMTLPGPPGASVHVWIQCAMCLPPSGERDRVAMNRER